MTVEFVATQSHYSDHLVPIWRALPDDVRGRWWAGRNVRHLVDRHGIDPDQVDHRRPPPDADCVVASHLDYRRTGGRVVMVNHGAGQRYNGDPDARRAVENPSYTGGRDRDRVVLYLCPGERDAAACREAQPDVPAVPVGVPKLDRLHTADRVRSVPPTVVVTFHVDLPLLPETRWAYPTFKDALPDLAADGRWEMVGHGHPRVFRHLKNRVWDRLGVPTAKHLDDVLEHADLLVGDNTSALYEAASCGIPVLCMNDRRYRRHIHHGLRFWSHVPGLQVDHANDLAPMVAEALRDPPEAARLRRKAVREVYHACDGHAAQRAAEAILEHLCR